MIVAILNLVTPLVNLFITWFIKDQARQAKIKANWKKGVNQLNNSVNDSIDISTAYDKLAKEQDERLAAARQAEIDELKKTLEPTLPAVKK